MATEIAVIRQSKLLKAAMDGAKMLFLLYYVGASFKAAARSGFGKQQLYLQPLLFSGKKNRSSKSILLTYFWHLQFSTIS